MSDELFTAPPLYDDFPRLFAMAVNAGNVKAVDGPGGTRYWSYSVPAEVLMWAPPRQRMEPGPRVGRVASLAHKVRSRP